MYHIIEITIMDVLNLSLIIVYYEKKNDSKQRQSVCLYFYQYFLLYIYIAVKKNSVIKTVNQINFFQQEIAYYKIVYIFILFHRILLAIINL